MDWHRRAAVPGVVGAAQRHPGDSVILQAAVPEADHTQMTRLAGNASPSCQTRGLSELQLPPLRNTPSPVLSQGDPEQQSTDCTEREHTELCRRPEASSSTGSVLPCVCLGTNGPQISLPEKGIMVSASGKRCGCVMKRFVYLHKGLASMKCLEKGVSLSLPPGPLLLLSPPDNTLRNL